MKTYDIVTIEQGGYDHILTESAQDVPFPLSEEHLAIIEAMTAKFDEENMAGLAAPQVGEPWRIILFHVTDFANSVRENVEESVPLTILINPSYEPIEEKGLHSDWEACFSVESKMGKVDRYNSIRYRGQTLTGESVAGIANGFLARLLQHEIDHTNGTLFVDHLKPDSIQGSREEMRALRMKEIEEWESET